MNQNHRNVKIMEILKQINDNSMIMEQDIEESEVVIYQLIKDEDYARGLGIKTFMGPSYAVFMNSPYVTDKGLRFIDSMKPIRMNKKNQMEQKRVFLERVENKDEDLNISNYRVDLDDYLEIVKLAIEEELVLGICIKYASNKGIVIHSNAHLSSKGIEYLDNPDLVETESKVNVAPSQVINIYGGDQRGAGFGINATINNNFDNSLEELGAFISRLSENEQKEANEILDAIKNGDIKPGMLSRFSTFLESHP
ncbi:TPA: hypothetical protein ACGX1C_003105, partial [Listeria monocytogenes]